MPIKTEETEIPWTPQKWIIGVECQSSQEENSKEFENTLNKVTTRSRFKNSIYNARSE